MFQRWMCAFLFLQVTFFVMVMEKQLEVLDFHGKKLYLEEWKIKESNFLHQRYCAMQDNLKLNIPIGAGVVTKKELELFSRALDWAKDMTLLYYYARLPREERYMLIDVARESKLDAKTLSNTLFMFYGEGLYMRELMSLQRNILPNILLPPKFDNDDYFRWRKKNWLQYCNGTLEPQGITVDVILETQGMAAVGSQEITVIEKGAELIKKYFSW